MPTSTASPARADASPVHTYQLFIQRDCVMLFTPSGYDGRHPIKSEQEGLHYRTLMTFSAMLRNNRLREPETELFGEYLYDVLLANEAGEKLHNALDAVPRAFLRVELHFESDAPAWMAQLPWEYLYRPRSKGGRGYFLATEARLALVRCPRVGATRALRIAAGEQLKVLLVACSPSDQEALEFAGFVEEMKALEPNIKLTTLITPFVKDVNWASANNQHPEATFDNFVSAMKDNPHVVHFLGHGRVEPEGGSIAFVDSGYAADWRSTKDLERVFADSSVRLAFLQACETSASGDSAVAYRALSSVAGALADTGVPAIVAMQARIQIAPASSFAAMFYRSIVKERQPLFRAMQEARLQAGNAACIPVLYLRYDTARKEQADFFFEESSDTTVPTGRSGGGVVVVGGGKCPWCSRTLDEDQTKEDCCPYCRSDLRCPNCSTLLRGTFGKEDVEAFCQKRGCEGVLRRSLWQRMPAATAAAPTPPRTDRAIMTGHTAPEQAAVGERQQDVFQT